MTSKPQLYLYCGLFAACCWVIADILLVGFVPRPEAYPLFSQTYAYKLGNNLDLAVLMLEGSTTRLSWGVFFATFSIVGYILSTLALWQLMRHGWMRGFTIAFFLMGISLFPLGHAGFFFVGETYKTLLLVNENSQAALLQLAATFTTMLSIHWLFAIVLLFLGSLLFLIQTVRAQTLLPRWAVVFNPIPIGFIIGAICSLFPQSTVATMINAATFNIAQLLFFISLLWFCRTKTVAVS